MKYYYLLLLAGLTACEGNHTTNNNNKVTTASDSAKFVTNDTIPEIRKTVSKKPVASYLVPVNDPKLERTFGVSVYETPHTFKYLLKMHYEAMEATDTLTVPNFGVWPVVQVQPGKDKRTCIIGFLDHKKTFKEYKMLTAKGNNMKLSVLKNYYAGRYRTVYKKAD